MNGRDTNTIQRDKFTLQHKHFCFIASVLAELPTHSESLRAAKQSVVNSFVAECKRHNNRFNPDRFIAACNRD
jgi:hypothetical protein